MARVKHKNPYGRSSHQGKPRGLTDKAFEKVYWPFIPILVGIVLMLPFAFSAHVAKNPFGRVLAYQTAQDPLRLLADTNAERRLNSQPALNFSIKLSQAAAAKANDMAVRDYWSHNTPEGNQPWVFVANTGYRYHMLGENLATGFNSDDDVIKAWMASSGHRENLLNPAYREVGFGYANVSDYAAAGGGPMTVVVAFFGDPAPTVTTALGFPSNQSKASSVPQVPIAVTKAELATGKVNFNQWLPVSIAVLVVSVSLVWAGHHVASIRRSSRSLKRYVYKHPVMDIGFILFVLIAIMLVQAAGYVL